MGLLLAAVAIAVIVGYMGIDRYVLHRGTAPSVAPSAPAQADRSIAGVAPAATFAPPPHSIAVLPFVNMSGEKEQKYFSDGLSEELLNDLSRITELQVAGRTSSFYFKGKDVDLSTIARKLNVGSVLEGSVRRSGHTVRVTAQLINAVTGFHLWSETYDRNLSDILQVQTEIAKAVTSALKVTLLGEVTEKIELGGTRNPNALDAFLRGRKAYSGSGAKEMQDAIAEFSEAIRLDPNRGGVFELCLAGCRGGPKDLQCIANRRHSDLVRSERTQGWRCLGSQDPRSDSALRAFHSRHLRPLPSPA
jgi:TolB-like protein